MYEELPPHEPRLSPSRAGARNRAATLSPELTNHILRGNSPLNPKVSADPVVGQPLFKLQDVSYPMVGCDEIPVQTTSRKGQSEWWLLRGFPCPDDLGI